jgi:hypothetical protein
MRANFSSGLSLIFAGALTLSVGAFSARGQAPEGPQGGQQQGAPPVEPKAAPPQQKPQEAGASIAVEVPVVTMDVIAATNHGDLLTGLKKENFRVIDDGVAQTISNFGSSEAPITIVMLMEFSSRGYYDWFAYQAKYWADAFFPNLKQKDWVALVTFDMKPMKCGTRFIIFIFLASASRMCLMRFWTRRSALRM